MTESKEMFRYVAFMRGINVSGHHKIPMAELRQEMAKIGCENIVTILNSGNVIFDSRKAHLSRLEEEIAAHLEKVFGFSVPTILRKQTSILQLISKDPFRDIVVTNDIRLYVSLLWKDVEADLTLPWISEDGSSKIIDKLDNNILSVLDISVSNTPKGMGIIESFYGKAITTRSWNTIKRIGKKLTNGQ